MIRSNRSSIRTELTQSRSEPPGPWVERWGAPPMDGARLFCFPHAGGGANIFRSWQAALPGIEVCPVQLPGRERRTLETPFNRMGDLVEAVVEGLASRLDRPFALFGHSNGALIAFELTKALRRAGAPGPAHLIVSGCAAPHLLTTLPELPDVRTDEQLLAELRRLSGTPDEILKNREAIELILPAVRADMQMFAAYVHTDEQPLQTAITALGGDRDVEVPESAVRGWASHTVSRFAYVKIPGDHFFVLSESVAVLSALERTLASLPSRAPGITPGHGV